MQDNADLKFATVKEVFAQVCINKCPKLDLRRKYLEMPMTPNFSQIIAIAKGHEGNLKANPKPFTNYANANANTNTQKPKSPKKQKTVQKTSAAKKPKTDGTYLGCIRCGSLDHFPKDCKFISHKCSKCNLAGHSENKCVIAKVKQAKSNAAVDVTFPITEENNDSTSEQLPAMKL